MSSREELGEIELERAPLAVELARVELAEDAGARARGLARMQEPMLAALEHRLGFQRGVERLDDTLHVQEAAFGDPGDANALVG
jgi:hypothetical protein